MGVPSRPPGEQLFPSTPETPQGAAATEVAAGECPVCGAPHQAPQEYCLECGARLPLARGVIPALRGRWTRHIGWYPGDWIWPVLLGLAIAAFGAVVAILASRNEQSARQTIVATTSFVPTTALPRTASAPEPAVAPPPTTPPSGGGLTEWPARLSGYTVVLASVPTSAGRAAATAAARKASGTGLAQVGVLESSRYSSLHPGYYVVFSGVFATLSDAQSAVSAARSRGYPGAYARQITS